jgi:diacylglycerol kinase family enzyme
VISVTCILNAAAGSGHGPDRAEEIARLCAELGTSATVVTVVSGAGIVPEARQALMHGQLILAGGGDGTVNAVASTLAGTGCVLGVLPLGTCNHFAKDLGLPLDLSGAVRVALTGRVKAVDVGDVNGQMFLNNSSLGLYPHLVTGRLAEQKQGHRKWVALAMAAVSCLRHPLPLLVGLRLDGADALVRRTPLLFVGNNRYCMTGPHMGGRTRLDAGELWMCVAYDAGYARLLGMTVRALAGHVRQTDLEMRSMADLWVGMQRREVAVARDGEITKMPTPLHYRIRPAALRVMVPV